MESLQRGRGVILGVNVMGDDELFAISLVSFAVFAQCISQLRLRCHGRAGLALPFLPGFIPSITSAS